MKHFSPEGRRVVQVVLVIVIGMATLFALASTPAVTATNPALPATLLPLESLPSDCLCDGAEIAFHAETGRIRFVGTEAGRPVPRLPGLLPSASPEVAARAYLSRCGSAFGLRDQARELRVLSEAIADRGRSFVRFQQVYQGIPVIGGELILQMDADKNVVSVNGEILPGLALDVAPAISAEAARLRALEKVAKDHGLDMQALTTSEPELWIYNPVILGGPGPRLSRLVWRLEVQPVELLPIRELVLVDAQIGVVLLHFNQIDTALYRRIYDNNNVRSDTLQNPANLRRIEGQGPSGIADVDRAYDYSGDVYNFYWNYHNRDSIDGTGMPLISTTRYCPASTQRACPYDNAFWNGVQMVYGQGLVVDDVVGHEMTHGVTDYTSRLFYYYQSGAINESFSDIWGEFIDLTNGKGNDSPAVRWLIAEDLGGAIRSMSNPPAYNDPDRMTSPYYECDLPEEDNGGVHTNSGVGNKAAFLMTDGGAFNGRTVSGLGILKVARIFYEAQTRLLTSASDYQDLYNALQQACTNLIGTSGITAADCQQVRNALDAVEMNQQPLACPAPHAPICDSGVPSHLFFDDLENPRSGKWASAATVGTNGWYYPQNPNRYDFDMTYATSGRYNMWGDDQDTLADCSIRMTSDVALPSGSTIYMHLNHAYGFEDNPDGNEFYDGGVLEYSTNGGVSWNDAGPLFINNGYNGWLSTTSGNPLGGRQAFVGESNGYISSRLNLSPLAGQNVRFRFRIGTDESVGDWGWFIDDVRIYTCATSPVLTPTQTPTSTVTLTPMPTTTATPGGPTPAWRYMSLPVVLRNHALIPTLTPTPPSSGWQTVVSTDFEGDFPGPWAVSDGNGSAFGEYYWGKRNCRAYAGNGSGWAVGAGAQGAALSCGSDYPDHASSRMVYGPFSLVGATAAELRFKAWLNTEPGYDALCYFASINNDHFYGECWWGYSDGWVEFAFDLSDVYQLGNLLGQPQVWVALGFYSDDAVPYAEGAYVDNVVLRRCPQGATCPADSMAAHLWTGDAMLRRSFAAFEAFGPIAIQPLSGAVP